VRAIEEASTKPISAITSAGTTSSGVECSGSESVSGDPRVRDRPDRHQQDAGDEPVQARAQHQQRCRDDGDHRRVRAPLPGVGERPAGLPEDVVAVRRRAERLRELRSDDQQRSGGHESHQQRLGHEVGDDARAQQADDDADHADHQCEQGCELDVARAADRGERREGAERQQRADGHSSLPTKVLPAVRIEFGIEHGARHLRQTSRRSFDRVHSRQKAAEKRRGTRFSFRGVIAS